jgi:hypothetical protein
LETSFVSYRSFFFGHVLHPGFSSATGRAVHMYIKKTTNASKTSQAIIYLPKTECSQEIIPTPAPMDSTPKPEINVDDLDCPTALRTQREDDLKKRFPKPTNRHKRRIRYILTKFRAKQKEMLDKVYKDAEYDDPDPYDETYLFYCFTGTLED